MSAITVGCLSAYKTSVDTTCDSVDSSIKVTMTIYSPRWPHFKCLNIHFCACPKAVPGFSM